MRRRGVWSFTAVAAMLTLAEAQAGDLRGGPSTSTPIFSGTEVETCGFPALVSLDNGVSLCTGTLVHPRVVLYAAHCGAGEMKVGFGESASAPAQVVTPSRCLTNPDYAGPGDEGADWAFCLLAEPAPVPVIPVAFGCERDLVETGGSALIVGFGEATEGVGAGPKRWAEAPIRLIFEDYVEVGGLTKPSVCAGDSGGPALIQAADGTWRTFGIASVHVDTCGGIGHYALAWDAVPWVEAEAGVEITPCHAQDETWHPDFRCTSFAGAESAGVGSWDDWCAAAPRGPASTSCGEAFDASPDTTPPTVSITSPSDTSLPGPEASVVVEVAAEDEGWGVAKVSLVIEGAVEAVDEEPPFVFPTAKFPAGTWTIEAIAEDAVGLTATSIPVVLEVGSDPATGGGESGEDGCGCATRGGPGWLSLVLALGWPRPRRRSHG